jgi:restriction endonuclease S subunit
MKIGLGKIADVQAGYSFRSRLESLESGAVSVIQMKDLTDENRVCCEELVKVDMEIPKAHHLLRPGDIIFRSRGLVTNSAIMLDALDAAVLAAPLLRIRCNNSVVMPEYLNWYINQKPAQSYLRSCAEGTALKMISKQSLENLEILVPSMERQRLISELAALVEQEQGLMKKLAERRSQYITVTLLYLAEGD